jgi:hypothetical protein
MPRARTPLQAFAMISSSCSKPTEAKIGRAWLEVAAGLAACATAQMEQDAVPFWLGWLWVDSAAAAHNSRDKQNNANDRVQNRISSYFGRDGKFF